MTQQHPLGVPAFDPTQTCSLEPGGNPMMTGCPRCHNPHHKCDRGSAVTAGVQSCRKCGGAMKPGKAIPNTYAASDEGTVNEAAHVGNAPLADCMKCEVCGWSVTAGVQNTGGTSDA